MKDKITDIKMLQAVFDASEDGILIFDNRGIILKANSAAENLYGYRSGKLLQKNVTELISEKLDTLLKETLKQDKTNKSNQVDAIRGIKIDGSLFPLNLSLSPYLIDEREVIIAFFRDTPTQLAHNINEAKRKKSGLIEQDRKFNNLVNNLPCIVYSCKNTKNWEA
ncbi:PAS domain S-box protein, partial [Xanthomarina sp.]|uniref:PAS domain-containing protein n=1 Tax=Xanthomarina sp. TaxID=1931211 RepID=UPI002B92C968